MLPRRRGIDRRNVEQLEFAGFRQSFAQLIADPHQAVMFVGPRAVDLTLKAGIEQFEIEHRDLRRIGKRRRS